MNILITGVAGFIGSAVAKKLIEKGDQVIGIDNLDPTLNGKIKIDRLEQFIGKADNFKFYKIDFTNYDKLEKIFIENSIDIIFHAGARVGPRDSIKNPFIYEKVNNLGTLNIFELAKEYKIKKVIFASSSSVYGKNDKTPFSVGDKTDTPISVYAVTKKYNELLAHAYHDLYGIQMIGLRFFTVYGPWNREDMAITRFTKAIIKGKPIDVYNHGKMKRDFTYIGDVVSGVIAAIEKGKGFEIFNIGNSNTIKLNYFIECLERELGEKSIKNLMPMQAADVKETFADITKSKQKLEFNPEVSIEEGIKNYVNWYKSYYF